MGHNSVVSGHPKSTGIPWVYGLSPGFGVSHILFIHLFGFTMVMDDGLKCKLPNKNNFCSFSLFLKKKPRIFWSFMRE